ncbi:hypothetical protein BDM02DRAFT_3190348 [Thelephora ganbajun]|uniref:Uncharacterized protein n=1 Tax=Thelephora ganbajun TaxID=370292 RepID=A0ACB6Z5C2_THEGA|nr:hypothetical protein BDM02DRAFT_3190348 [Thelephora ganbajun]
MTATKEVIGPAVGGLLAMLAFPVGMVWIFKLLINYRITDRALFVRIYLECSRVSAWSVTVRDKEFLVEMRLRNLEPEETKERAVEKKEEQEQEEAALRDLPMLDLIENQSDGESDNEERFLL